MHIAVPEDDSEIFIVGYTFDKDKQGWWMWSDERYKKEKKEIIKLTREKVLDELDIWYRKKWFNEF